MHTLITGSTGFIGSHLKKELPKALDFADREGPIDLRDFPRLQQFIGTQSLNGLNAVIHLAAQSHVPTAFASPGETLQVNFIGTFHLLEALVSSGFSGRFIFVSSADVYGNAEQFPITEDMPPKPSNPYAVSKRCAEELTLSYKRRELIDAVVARPFNLIGPGQSANFAVSSFAKQVVQVELGMQEQIEVGNLDVSRDLLDVRDAVLAYKLLLEPNATKSIYNICSGQEYSLRNLLDELMLLGGCTVPVVHTARGSRKNDKPHFLGSYELLNQDTNWSPTTTLHASLESVLNDWREKLCRKKSLL